MLFPRSLADKILAGWLRYHQESAKAGDGRYNREDAKREGFVQILCARIRLCVQSPFYVQSSC
jgi:hypothetical protein